MNRLRGIKSLWCDKERERERVLESVSVWCLSGGGRLSTPLSHQWSPSVFPLLRRLLSRRNHFLSSLPLLFITLFLLAVRLCFPAFTPFSAERLRACLSPPTSFFQFFSPTPVFPHGCPLPSCSGRLVSAEQQRGGLSAAPSRLGSSPLAPHAFPLPRRRPARSSPPAARSPRAPASPLSASCSRFLRGGGGTRPGPGLVIVNTRQRGSLKMAAHPVAVHAGARPPGSAAGQPG